MIYALPDGSMVTSADYNLPGTHRDLLLRGLTSVNEHSGNSLNVDLVAGHVLEGRLKNLTAIDMSGDPVGFVLYHVSVADYDTELTMHVIAMYMDKGREATTNALIEFLKTLAKDMGAKRIVGISRRKGWSRRMKPDRVLQLGVWDV